MSRFRVPTLALAMVMILGPLATAEEAQPKQPGLSAQEVARMILLGGDGEQVLVAQYLARADQATLLGVQMALRGLAPKVASQMKRRAAEPAIPTVQEGAVDLVTMETHIVEVRGDARDLFDLCKTKSGTSNVGLLDEAQLELVLRAIEKSERMNLVTAPRITVYDKQRANVQLMNQVSFIQDFDIEARGENWMLDPIIGVVSEGLVLDMRPVISKDRKYVTLEAGLTWADLKRPMTERQIILRKGTAPVTIQLPEINVGGGHATATIPVGGAFLLASQATFGAGKQPVHRVALVSVQVITLDKDDVASSEERVPAPVQPKSSKRVPGGPEKAEPGK